MRSVLAGRKSSIKIKLELFRRTPEKWLICEQFSQSFYKENKSEIEHINRFNNKLNFIGAINAL